MKSARGCSKPSYVVSSSTSSISVAPVVENYQEEGEQVVSDNNDLGYVFGRQTGLYN